MTEKKDNPGVVIPPPLIYASFFLTSLLLQKFIPLSKEFFNTTLSTVMGYSLIVIGLVFALPAFFKFFKSGNTLITIKPANSLQTSGIYSKSRNPMYLSLLLLYTGLSFLTGNWWTLILIPILVTVVTQYIIRREENYLQRAFGQAYSDYKKATRRWL